MLSCLIHPIAYIVYSYIPIKKIKRFKLSYNESKYYINKNNITFKKAIKKNIHNFVQILLDIGTEPFSNDILLSLNKPKLFQTLIPHYKGLGLYGELNFGYKYYNIYNNIIVNDNLDAFKFLHRNFDRHKQLCPSSLIIRSINICENKDIIYYSLDHKIINIELVLDYLLRSHMLWYMDQNNDYIKRPIFRFISYRFPEELRRLYNYNNYMSSHLKRNNIHRFNSGFI